MLSELLNVWQSLDEIHAYKNYFLSERIDARYIMITDMNYLKEPSLVLTLDLPEFIRGNIISFVHVCVHRSYHLFIFLQFSSRIEL